MAIEIHLAQPTHVPEMTRLAEISWKQFQSQLTEENWAKLLAGISNPDTYRKYLQTGTGFVALENGKMTGMAFLLRSGEANELFEAGWSTIRMVSVHPDFLGKGIGRSLTEKCIDHAKLTGEKTIALHTSEMMNAARHIYEKLGFRILKEIPQRLGKQYWIYKMDI